MNMRRMLACILAALMMAAALPALAEDVCTVKDAASATLVTTDCSYLQVLCPLTGEARVVLTVQDGAGRLIYQRDHGVCSGAFRSGEIYLPLEDAAYTVTVSAGEAQHVFRVQRERPLLTDTGVYAAALTLKEMMDGSRRQYAVVMDMAALDGRTLTVPLVAGGMQVGVVHLRVEGSSITAEAQLTVDGSISKGRVYLARDAWTAATLGSSRFSGTRGSLGQPLDAGHTPYAAVMVQLTIAYDDTTAQAWQPDEAFRREQLQWWQQMQLVTPNDANG